MKNNEIKKCWGNAEKYAKDEVTLGNFKGNNEKHHFRKSCL